MKPLYGVESHQKIRPNGKEFEKIEKKTVRNWMFLGLILVMFLRCESYDFDVIARIGP